MPFFCQCNLQLAPRFGITIRAASARPIRIKSFEHIVTFDGSPTLNVNDYYLHLNTSAVGAQKTLGLVLNNELTAFHFHERPQAVLSQLGYGLCDDHFNRFWANPGDATKEWHIVLNNYEDVRAKRNHRGVKFAALAFQMARISILSVPIPHVTSHIFPKQFWF